MEVNVFRLCTGLRVLGWLMAAFVLGIVGMTWWAMTAVAFGPLLVAADSNGGIRLLAAIILLLFHALLFMLLWCYFATLTTDAGSVPPGWRPDYLDVDVEEADNRPLIGHNRVRPRYCRKCCQWKPERTHHCSVCGRCVLKMDHHCVWVVNCVGARNYKAFLLFLVYTCLDTTLVSISLLPYTIEFFKGEVDDEGDDSEHWGIASVFMAFVLNLAFALSVAGFLAMHFSLVIRNTTTIEVFGTERWHWFLPKYTQEDLTAIPALSGLSYPSREDMDPDANNNT
eukprot:jgi/Chlat1/4951/Chrsp32S04943